MQSCKGKLLFAAWVICWLIVGWILLKPESDRRSIRIYDESADGSWQVSHALTIAKKENKRVLIQFGANWCVWCHRLHDFFDSDRSVKKELRDDYIVVMVDVKSGHNAHIVQKYGNPVELGIPVIVILDSDGKQLVTKQTDDLLVNGTYDSQKTLEFLMKWAADIHGY